MVNQPFRLEPVTARGRSGLPAGGRIGYWLGARAPSTDTVTLQDVPDGGVRSVRELGDLSERPAGCVLGEHVCLDSGLHAWVGSGLVATDEVRERAALRTGWIGHALRYSDRRSDTMTSSDTVTSTALRIRVDDRLGQASAVTDLIALRFGPLADCR